MNTSDFLISIDSSKDLGLFFPSKIVDYLGTNNPILALTKNKYIKETLSKGNGICLQPNQQNLINNFFLDSLKEKNIFKKRKSIMKRFDGNIISKEFEKIIKEL